MIAANTRTRFIITVKSIIRILLSFTFLIMIHDLMALSQQYNIHDTYCNLTSLSMNLHSVMFKYCN